MNNREFLQYWINKNNDKFTSEDLDQGVFNRQNVIKLLDEHTEYVHSQHEQMQKLLKPENED